MFLGPLDSNLHLTRCLFLLEETSNNVEGVNKSTTAYLNVQRCRTTDHLLCSMSMELKVQVEGKCLNPPFLPHTLSQTVSFFVAQLTAELGKPPSVRTVAKLVQTVSLDVDWRGCA